MFILFVLCRGEFISSDVAMGPVIGRAPQAGPLRRSGPTRSPVLPKSELWAENVSRPQIGLLLQSTLAQTQGNILRIPFPSRVFLSSL